MNNYGKFCPIAKAASVLSERWTLLILRELMCGSSRFNELERGLPGISRAMLSKRLRTLVECGIVTNRSEAESAPGYFLTTRGMELKPLVIGIGEWGQRWLNSGTRTEDIDTDLLMWDIHRRIDLSSISVRRLVVEIEFYGLSRKRYWLVIEGTDVSVCSDPPGFENDLTIEADTLTFHDVWMGRADLVQAMKLNIIRMHGPTELVRAFIQSLQLNLFAQIPHAEHLSGARAS